MGLTQRKLKMFRRLDKVYIVDSCGKKKYGRIIECHMSKSGKMYYSCQFDTQVIKLPDHLLNKED